MALKRRFEESEDLNEELQACESAALGAMQTLLMKQLGQIVMESGHRGVRSMVHWWRVKSCRDFRLALRNSGRLWRGNQESKTRSAVAAAQRSPC